MSDCVAGVDGCKSGWIAAICPPSKPEKAELIFFATFAEILSHSHLKTIAIDIPIGLPDFGLPGGRIPDREARKKLGPRRSSVFSVPSRKTVMCDGDYQETCKVARATSKPPRAISRQAFGIFARVLGSKNS